MKEDITPYNDKNEHHGYWERYYINGEVWYKGFYVNGKVNGYEEFTYGDRCSLTFNL